MRILMGRIMIITLRQHLTRLRDIFSIPDKTTYAAAVAVSVGVAIAVDFIAERSATAHAMMVVDAYATEVQTAKSWIPENADKCPEDWVDDVAGNVIGSPLLVGMSIPALPRCNIGSLAALESDRLLVNDNYPYTPWFLPSGGFPGHEATLLYRNDVATFAFALEPFIYDMGFTREDITPPQNLETEVGKVVCANDSGLCVAMNSRQLPLPIVAGVSLIAVLLTIGGIGYHRKRSQSPKEKVKKAFRDNAFYPLLQPVIATKTNEAVGFEVLGRLSDGGETIMPGLFITELNRLGRTWEYTERVLAKLEEQWISLGAGKTDQLLSINVEIQDVLNRNVMSLARDHSIKKIFPNIVVEITEYKEINFKVIAPILRDLQSAGVLVALDDFGSGYANQDALIELPVDIVKVDKLVLQDKTNKVLLSNLRLLEEMDIVSCVEGVENRELAGVVESAPVSFVQGYHYSYPVSPDQIVATWLNRTPTKAWSPQDA